MDDSRLESAQFDVDLLQELLKSPEIDGLADELVSVVMKGIKNNRGNSDENKTMKNTLYSFEERLSSFPDYQLSSDVYLAALHRVIINKIISQFLRLLDVDSTKEDFSKLEGLVSSKLVPSNEMTVRFRKYTESIAVLFRSLGIFGFDRPSEELESSPLNPPFDKIDVRNPVWARNLEVAENFSHAMCKLFDAHGYINNILTVFSKLRFSQYDRAQYFSDKLRDYYIETLPAVLSVFRNFQTTLMEEKKGKETLDVNVFGEQLNLLLRARFGMHFRSMKDLPVDFYSKTPDLKIENVDKDGLILAIFEIMKNAFRDDKVSLDQLNGYKERGESYMSVNVGEAVMNGKNVIAIEITDRGTQIDVHAIIEKMGDLLKGWESRDITFGQMLDYLSQRHVSIPLKGFDGKTGEMSTGIGLHSARSIIRAHNGEMFPVNLKDGVSFLVIIPKEGKDADWNVTDEKVTGADCGEISAKISTSQADFREAIAKVLENNDSDGLKSGTKKTEKSQNPPTSAFVFA